MRHPISPATRWAMRAIKPFSTSLVVSSLVWQTSYGAISHTFPPQQTHHSGQAQQRAMASNELRKQISLKLDESEWKQKMNESGIDQEEVRSRLAAMTDQELQEIQKQLPKQVGGDRTVVISTTTLLLIIIIVILLA